VFDAPWQRQSKPQRPAPRAAPRCVNLAPTPTPTPTPSPAAIKPTLVSTVRPRSLLTLPEHEFVGVCPENGVPAATQASATVDRPRQPSSTPSALWLASSDLSEASRAADWTPPQRRRRINVSGLQPAVVAHRPSHTVRHSLIPCAYDILDLQ
jgi:hypothetical protein